MPLIRINHAAPLSPEVIENLLHTVTDAYVTATGSDPAAVHVLVERVQPENWAVGGTSLAARNAR
ncbi:tautomerase family protein [Streptosporangium sp. NBC_01755]|uniref:tautomerase family protein n=1 Tax=unclassified Streptosporangium TaxID=2632669 RepID=UPI002DDC796D|nr:MULTISPECIES: tautomerase family protein [unclassified Streptosporangium]WSA25606.1 tautomerase family protein [Streptosporangium sp. NBC_01810]WSD03006.1 tautomerase family protein [Streptosporangium sp. NBC_01755]